MSPLPSPEQAVDDLLQLLIVIAHQALTTGRSEDEVLQAVTRLARMVCKTVRQRMQQ